MHYEVLYADTLDDLEDKIEDYKIAGWETYGGITICSREQYYQTMISK